MRILLSLALLASVSLLNAQNNRTKGIDDLKEISESINKIGVWISNPVNENEISGSPYLFNTWNNVCKLYLEETVYTISDFNYNIDKERFEAKFADDSVLVMNAGNFKKVVINNVTLKPHYDNMAGKITFFEEIATLDDAILLKRYLVKIKEGSFNPMTQKQVRPSTYVKDEQFYIKETENADLKPIRLKKSSILKLVAKDHQDEVKAYAKEKKLKYSKPEDVHAILQYENSL